MTTKICHEEERVNTANNFKTNVSILTETLSDIIYNLQQRGRRTIDPTLFALGSNFVVSVDAVEMLEAFFHGSFDKWEVIKNRDRKFLEDRLPTLFPRVKELLGDQEFASFSSLFTDPDLLSKDDLDYLWDFLETQVVQCIKYVHWKREPYSVEESDGRRDIYKRPDVLSHIEVKNEKGEVTHKLKVDVLRLAEVWSVELDFGQLVTESTTTPGGDADVSTVTESLEKVQL